MKISIVGTGYVGLVSGACLAEKGHEVTCIDIDRAKVDMINSGRPPIHEKGLAEILKRHAGNRLNATTDLEGAVVGSDLSMIAVGTPYDGTRIDLKYIEAAARQIGQALARKATYHMVVVKSTVVPGTTDGVVLPILEKASGKKAGEDFGVGMNPEFLREGEAVADFMAPDRIVLGAIDEKSLAALESLYSVFPDTNIVRTGTRTAEMIKYAANALLATMISFSNEIGNLCSTVGGIDVVDVMQGIHLDKRLSPLGPGGNRVVPGFTTYLEAGCGFGGSCFPKDVKALISHGNNLGMPMALLDAVIRTNAAQPMQLIELLRKHYDAFRGLSVAVLGLAFKPGTDDMRESPAIPVIRTLLAEGAVVTAFDPVARKEAEKLFDGQPIRYCDALRDTIADADAVILITRWEEFRALPQLLNGRSPAPVVIDGRRMLDKKDFDRYEGIGLQGCRLPNGATHEFH